MKVGGGTIKELGEELQISDSNKGNMPKYCTTTFSFTNRILKNVLYFAERIWILSLCMQTWNFGKVWNWLN
jgi:hypothetical protein